jgi:hypothetical protein
VALMKYAADYARFGFRILEASATSA